MRTYTCVQCNGEFESGWTEEEALAECAENGWAEDPELVVVCDDCYQMMITHLPPAEWNAQQEAQA